MRAAGYCILIVGLLLLFSCAVRDNEYDPLSPLHKSPVISVSIDFDSTRITYASQEAISGMAPFEVDVGASANDFFHSEKKTSVIFRHYYNDTLQKELVDFSKKSIVLKSAGEHTLSFSSGSENGATTNREIAISLTAPKKPEITSFHCQFDTLPLHATIPVSFFIEATDTNLIADSIVYAISSINQPVHYVQNLSILLRDTLSVSRMYSDSEYTQTITAYIYDKTDSFDSASTAITFSNDKRVIRGIAPIIDTVLITEVLPVIYTEKMLPFSFSAQDDADGSIIDTTWDFGDNSWSKIGHPEHAFREPGVYTVTVTLTDDSLNQTSKSMEVEVKKKGSVAPEFTTFTVDNYYGPAPLTVTLTAVPYDEDGYIRYMGIAINGRPEDPVWPPVRNEKFTFEEPGIYYIIVFAYDDDGNRCEEIRKIRVTDPELYSEPEE